MDVQLEIERFGRDRRYVEQHREGLLQRYPEQRVAVYNQQVVGVAKTSKQLAWELERKGIPSGQTYWEWLTDQDQLWILPAATP